MLLNRFRCLRITVLRNRGFYVFFFFFFFFYLNRGTAIPTRLHVRPADSDQPAQCTLLANMDPKRLQADSEDTDQIARLRRLI